MTGASPEHDVPRGTTQHPKQPFGDELRPGVQIAGLEQHDELIAAESRGGVAVAEDRLQPRSDSAQQLIPGGVTECVVDVLEAVEIDVERGHRPLRARRVRASAKRDRAPAGDSAAL